MSLVPDSFQSFLYSFLVGLVLIKLLSKKDRHPPLPPGPSPWPIVGNLPEMLMNRPAYKWIAGVLEQLGSDIACIRLGNVHVVAVKSARIAREFLHEQDTIFASRPLSMTSEYATYGYLTMGLTPFEDQWKKIRKTYTRELMSPSRLKWSLHKRNEEANNLINLVYNQCSKDSDGAVVDVREAVRHYCANAIRKMTFSKRYFGRVRVDGGPGEAEKEHVDAVFTLLAYMTAFAISDFLPWTRFLDLEGHEKIVRQSMRVINKYHDPVIEDRIHQWNEGMREEPQDFLDILITLKDERRQPLLSVDEIRAQCAELFFPCDNPSNAVEWIMAEMLNQPDILHRATKEIDMVVGEDRFIQESDIPKLNYLKACVKESLRLHPVTPFLLPHVATSDAVVAGYFIPKGSQVLVHRPGLARHPVVWEEPSRFKPERHFSNGGAASSTVDISEPDLRFVAFSAGKRGCPAISLGTGLSVMLLGRLLQGFTWSIPANVKSIDLSESSHDLALAEPLHAHAKPRLPMAIYLAVTNDAAPACHTNQTKHIN